MENKSESNLIKLANVQTDFRGSAQRGLEPDYEMLRKHIEVWVQRHPKEMQEYLVYRKQQLKDNLNKTGASDSGNLRGFCALPESLFGMLVLVAPNFLGAEELTPLERRQRARLFVKKFPAFQTCEKL